VPQESFDAHGVGNAAWLAVNGDFHRIDFGMSRGARPTRGARSAQYTGTFPGIWLIRMV
jgi:hypothetical protein